MPVMLIAGTDQFLRSNELRAIKAKYVHKDTESLNLDRYSDNNFDANRLIQNLQMPPMMAEYRLIILEDSSLITDLSDDIKDKITAILLRLDLSIAFVILHSGNVPKWIKSLKPEERHCDQFKSWEQDKAGKWLVTYARNAGIQCDVNAANLLIQFIGLNRTQLVTELQKLAVYSGNNAITVDTVRLVSGKGGSNPFDFLDAVKGRKKTEALRLLHNLLFAGEEPIALSGLIASHFMQLMQAYETGSKNPDIIAEALGKTTFQAKQITMSMGVYDQAQTRQVIWLLHETDFQMKTGRLPASIALETAVARITL